MVVVFHKRYQLFDYNSSFLYKCVLVYKDVIVIMREKKKEMKSLMQHQKMRNKSMKKIELT